jgi:hypothetical protein
MINDLAAIGVTAIVTVLGLAAGMVAWRLYIAFSTHRPSCPFKDEVIQESKRVVLDITQLTQGRPS